MPKRSQPSRPEACAPLLIVLGTGDRTYRSWDLEQLAAAYPLALLDRHPPAWACAHAHRALSVDLADTEVVATAARTLAARDGVAGVLTLLENHVELAAQLAHRLGLPGATPAAAAACRDKLLTRALLRTSKVPSARSYLVDDADSAVAYAAVFAHPVVLKPRHLSGSTGVRRADTPQQVQDAFHHARTATLPGLEHTGTPGVLIEEYLAGPEISVECVVLTQTTTHIAAITRKSLGAEPSFVEVGHLVDAADPLLADPGIRDIATRAVQAMGIERGVLHLEMRLTPRGPRIIEVNARPGGDLIPRLVHLATGLNLPRITADLATGTQPDVTPTRHRSAAVRFLYPQVTGHVTAVNSGFTAPWLTQFLWTAAPGEHVTAPPHATAADRTALALVTGPTPATCRKRLDRAQHSCGIHIQADTATTARVA
ncbi:ATP-grasp domain-containing protein [Streptomyces spectabilis]|uniref:Biotin carboxylase n=1 Tax=Streptomyces spectabilis TaxID=68270 RepID=A0A7W8B3V4_STRST|nr:ATP-grasp domain-containing protein [Streptomyces spectabilis]MBB5109860.1 biotin carboxylase [Streptomyces spectabilis]GGV55855.1 carboxylase [Streptomyces spectabilis]